MEKQSKTWLWVIGILVVVGVVYLVMTLNSSTPATNESASKGENGPIKIGVIAPLTGDAAAYGEPLQKVIALAVEEINNAGGLGGRMFQFTYEDGKCNGKDGANAMQKLVNIDKVKVVIGGFCSSESLAAVPIATANKVVLFSGGSSSPDLTNVSSYFLRDYPSDAAQGKVLAEIAYGDKKWRKVVFIQEQLDYPLGIFKAFSSNFERLGGQTSKEEFTEGTTDFRSQLTKLRGLKPDALFIDTQTPAAAERIFKQLTELKWKVPLLVSDAVTGDPAVVEKNATILEGALAAEFGTDPNNATFKHLLEAYKQKHNVDVPYQSYAQTMYDAVYIVRDGIKAVGYDGEKLALWSRTIKDWKGASGLVTIGSDGDRVSGHIGKVIKKGKVEVYGM
ncbi:ABC transporter substrate-binding protein [Candidatus Jorgensenbacteria bacterium]|nr:ABC transporter substrate-binding protein [Candidatus Jorgensenbacteria bacterium]